MRIYIPTVGRIGRQTTLATLREAGAPATLVTTPAELPALRAAVDSKDVEVVACPLKGIANTRDWIVHEHHNTRKHGPHLLMLDDDLRWSERRKDDPTKFSPATPASLRRLLADVEKMLGKHAHGSVSQREQAHTKTEKYTMNTRLLRALAYDVKVMRAEGVRFNRIPFMEDFDVTLQLLRLGYSSFTVNGWVQNQSGSGAAGGCSITRTAEKQSAAAHKLCKLHGDFVKVVQKTTKNGWAASEAGTRDDVVIQWKRAYASAAGKGGAA